MKNMENILGWHQNIFTLDTERPVAKRKPEWIEFCEDGVRISQELKEWCYKMLKFRTTIVYELNKFEQSSAK